MNDVFAVFFAYAIVSLDKAILFVNPAQIDDIVRAHLEPEVEIQSYDHFFSHLRGLGAELNTNRGSVSNRVIFFNIQLLKLSVNRECCCATKQVWRS